MTSCNPHLACHCLDTLHLVPTDPPEGSPSCSVQPALNHTSLKVLCSWPGGFPSASLRWTGDLKQAAQDEVNAGQLTNPVSNTAILLPPEDLASNSSLFTCVGSHPALQRSTECTTRTCENQISCTYSSLNSDFYENLSCLFFSTRCSPCAASVLCLCD